MARTPSQPRYTAKEKHPQYRPLHQLLPLIRRRPHNQSKAEAARGCHFARPGQQDTDPGTNKAISTADRILRYTSGGSVMAAVHRLGQLGR
ncbi:hypothetical protein Pcinc_034044 [Petrolisthes cinctipes]|uniref:Uncharacterized protein n=1 Tax=Petrolisthes cinctipes TaxID=88211 RepID=A0AAE1ER41_PETCI|nr:hypothetical protein Pcinc_034044 [Petrolisthes cinctipes]